MKTKKEIQHKIRVFEKDIDKIFKGLPQYVSIEFHNDLQNEKSIIEEKILLLKWVLNVEKNA